MSLSKYELVDGGYLLRGVGGVLSDESELFLDLSAVRRSSDREDRDTNARRALEILIETGIGAGSVEFDESGEQVQDSIDIGLDRRGYGAIGMRANLAWPVASDGRASSIATVAMRQTARDMGTFKDIEIDGNVYANVDRCFGITLETNPVGSCSMDTSGDEYSSSANRVTLYSHNLYTHEMQLICISGLIAISKLR